MEDTEIANLRDALQRRNALIDGAAVEIRESGERALVATRRFYENEVVLRIPASEMVTARRARECPAVAAVLKEAADAGMGERIPDTMGDDAAIRLYLLYELSRGNESPLKMWFDTLPDIVETPLTMFHMFGGLKGSPLLHLSKRLHEELVELYKEWVQPYAIHAHGDAFSAAVCTFKTFKHIHAICDSRAFHIEDVTLLAPYADMVNHAMHGSDGVNLRVRASPGSTDVMNLELVTCSTVRPGDELCISYGPLPNSQLLLHYGFTMRDNVYDSLPLTFSLPDGDSAHVQAKKLILFNLDSAELLSLSHELTIADPLPIGLVASARLLVMDEVDIEPITIHNADFSKNVSDANEAAVEMQLTNLFHKMLDGYVTHNIMHNMYPVDRNSNRYQRYCAIYIESMTTIIKRAYLRC